jgi:transposase-like protein
MPWNEVEPMEEKERFVALAQTGRFTITELCRDFEISRKTGHKYLKRYRVEGKNGLAERNRRPKGCPWATDAEVERLILKERREHPTWGPKKIRVRLERVYGVSHPPHESTIGLILKRQGKGSRERGQEKYLAFVGASLVSQADAQTSAY